jgi:hypothetical protein
MIPHFVFQHQYVFKFSKKSFIVSHVIAEAETTKTRMTPTVSMLRVDRSPEDYKLPRVHIRVLQQHGRSSQFKLRRTETNSFFGQRELVASNRCDEPFAETVRGGN